MIAGFPSLFWVDLLAVWWGNVMIMCVCVGFLVMFTYGGYFDCVWGFERVLVCYTCIYCLIVDVFTVIVCCMYY